MDIIDDECVMCDGSGEVELRNATEPAGCPLCISCQLNAEITSLRQQLAEQTSGDVVEIKVTRGSDGRLLLTQPDGKYFDVNEAIGKKFYAKGSL
jgi:hypothetical protein